MRIAIVAVGRLKEDFWRRAADEYLKRLRPYADVRVVEIADRDPGKGGEDRAVSDEGNDVLRAVPEGAYLIALDIAGRQSTSESFADKIARLGVEGRGSIAFAIGGSHGLSGPVLHRADERLSLGPMTFPHNIARVLLLEQLYRSFRIIRNEPYHK